MPTSIPSVEIPDHADALRIGSPEGKRGPIDALDHPWMGSQNLVGFQMFPLAQQIEINLSELRGKSIGIMMGRLRPVGGDNLNLIRGEDRCDDTRSKDRDPREAAPWKQRQGRERDRQGRGFS